MGFVIYSGKEGISVNGVIRCITKMALILEVILVLILLVIVRVLQSVEPIRLQVIHYVLILGCVAGLGCLFFSLIRILFSFLRWKNREGGCGL